MTTDGQLHEKYVVQRTDRTDGRGMKHDACDYFVLDLTHDPFAIQGVHAYADACEETHPQLAADIRNRYRPPAAEQEVPS